MHYTQEFEEYYSNIDLTHKAIRYLCHPLNPTKELIHKLWLKEEAYKKAHTTFDEWWEQTYPDFVCNLNPSNVTLELAFKEVAKAAWDNQQTKLENTREEAEVMRSDFTSIVKGDYKFTWE